MALFIVPLKENDLTARRDVGTRLTIFTGSALSASIMKYLLSELKDMVWVKFALEELPTTLPKKTGLAEVLVAL